MTRPDAARSGAAPETINFTEILDLLGRMWLIRAFEERVSELYATGRIKGLLHLGIGQEAVAVGAADALLDGDHAFGTHRAHAHALAMGADPERLLAEVAGLAAGYGKGKGGSMHITAPRTPFVTATGVVGGGIPLGIGAAYAGRVRGDGSVALAFFGDGAGQTGSFHESLNLCALWQLPLVLVCENNGYAEFTPLSVHTPIERLAIHAQTYGIPTQTVDGNDVLAVRHAMKIAVQRARAGGGPQFVEALTYRLRGHYEGDPAKYRELSELADWRARDPILVLAASLPDGRREGALADAERAARERIDASATAALAGPAPSPDQLTSDVLAP